MPAASIQPKRLARATYKRVGNRHVRGYADPRHLSHQTGCTVAADKYDFVSTMVHEVLHGLGLSTSFDQDQSDPTIGYYSDPPVIMDEYVIQVSDGAKLLSLPNDSTTASPSLKIRMI